MLNNVHHIQLPLTEGQAIFIAVIVVIIIVVVNVLNSIVYAKINKKHTIELLEDVSKQLLVKAGYLKPSDKNNG